MAGGIGSRFWPISRKSLPKQFIDILGTGKSLIQQTFERFSRIVPTENIYIVTNEDYLSLVKEQIPQIAKENILAEPMARNTAPCVAFATWTIAQKDPNAVCVVAPSDHLILDESVFNKIIEDSFAFAQQYDALLTLGIRPTRPDTGYGYIQFDTIPAGQGFHKVKLFTEKPTLEIAKTFVESGEFLWNSGIFIWQVQSIIKQFEIHLEEIFSLFQDIDFSSAESVSAEIKEAYSQCTSISVDYGIMEKAANVYVYPASFGWNDLGTWKSLWDVSEKNDKHTVAIGKQIHTPDSENCLVYSNTGKLMILKGVKNLIVVDCDDAIVIIEKDREQELRQVVIDLRDEYKGKYT